jgi:hypothetical protein
MIPETDSEFCCVEISHRSGINIKRANGCWRDGAYVDGKMKILSSVVEHESETLNWFVTCPPFHGHEHRR